MNDNEFILFDRITKIKSIIGKYGEENFYQSYSGGKDSNVLSALLDMALPDNKIPRVYANTGIEYKLVVDFVQEQAAKDDRFVIIKPKTPIKPMLEKVGYPFKSKQHSHLFQTFYKSGRDCITVKRYLKEDPTRTGWFNANCCPNILKYQFEEPLPFTISDKCCDELKKNPLKEWQKENNRPISIIGIMTDEGGQRSRSAGCLAFKHDKNKTLKAFQPLIPVTKEWENWFVEEYKIPLPKLYYPPYNFNRTGCKGCPFAIELQEELDTLETFFPNERKQCERIWQPVYAEYRRLGYRLRKDEQLNIFDYQYAQERE